MGASETFNAAASCGAIPLNPSKVLWPEHETEPMTTAYIRVHLCDDTVKEMQISNDATALAVSEQIAEQLSLQDVASFGIFTVVKMEEERKVGLFKRKEVNSIEAEVLLREQEAVMPYADRKLYFKKRIHRPGEALAMRPDKIHVHMLYIQAMKCVVNGSTPATLDGAAKLAGLYTHAQPENDGKPSSRWMQSLLPRNVGPKTNPSSWEKKLLSELKSAAHLSKEEAEWRCLQLCERLPLYGAESFGANKVRADPSSKVPSVVGIAVGALGVQLYDESNRRVALTFAFDTIVDNDIRDSVFKPGNTDWSVSIQHSPHTGVAQYLFEVPRASEVRMLVELYRAHGGASAGPAPVPIQISPAPSEASNSIARDPSPEMSLGSPNNADYDWAALEDEYGEMLSDLSDFSEEEEELSPAALQSMEVSKHRVEYWLDSHSLACTRVQRWQLQTSRLKASATPAASAPAPAIWERARDQIDQAAELLRNNQQQECVVAAPVGCELPERVVSSEQRWITAVNNMVSALQAPPEVYDGEPLHPWSVVVVLSALAMREALMAWGMSCWINSAATQQMERQHQYQAESASRMKQEAVQEAQKALSVASDVLEHKQKILARELVRLRKRA